MTGLRVGIAGLGIGRKHLTAYNELRDLFSVTALCDPDAARAAALSGDAPDAATESDFAALLARDDVDIVDVCTPHHMHYEQVLQALAAGKHVICEKPVVGSLAACDTLIAAEVRTGKHVMPVFQYRFGVGLQKLLHLVSRGVTGKHYLSTAETVWKRGPEYYSTAWRGQRSAAMGGCLLTQAIHAHDAINIAIGDIRRVYGVIATRVNPVETEDCAAATLTFADGSLATLAVTLGAARDTSRLLFCFEHLTAESSLAPYTMTAEPWTFTPRSDAAGKANAAALADFVGQPEGFVGQFSRFHRALTEGGPLPVTLTDARRSLELLTALYHSAATGEAVDLPLADDHAHYEGWLDR